MFAGSPLPPLSVTAIVIVKGIILQRDNSRNVLVDLPGAVQDYLSTINKIIKETITNYHLTRTDVFHVKPIISPILKERVDIVNE